MPAATWRLVVTLVGLTAGCAGGQNPLDPGIILAAADLPQHAEFITRDIENFWVAYDAGGKDGSAQAFQREYLDRASPGLRDFINARSITAASLVQTVRAYPGYFADIRPNTLRLGGEAALLARIRANYQNIEARYPDAIYPPVTFLIGRFSTGGTIRQSGILIGTEFFAIDNNTPLTELGAFQRANVKPLDSIPVIIAHEHAHVLQSRASPLLGKPRKTLLEQALIEGSADFLAELVAGAHINAAAHAYGLAHEAELWCEFAQEMNETDVGRWLYNQGSAGATRPGDLGYFIGYRITQAFHTRVTDKNAALRDIIGLLDANAFLTASGYARTCT